MVTVTAVRRSPLLRKISHMYEWVDMSIIFGEICTDIQNSALLVDYKFSDSRKQNSNSLIRELRDQKII